MTELEQRLQIALEIQQKAFMEELQAITKHYDQNMSEAMQVIAKQKDALGKYESISTNWQISINQTQLDELESMANEREQRFEQEFQRLMKELVNSNKVIAELENGLMAIRQELANALGQLNELQSDL